MPGSYRLTRPRRALNLLVKAMLRRGVAPKDTYLLTVPGRKTGRPYSTPVMLVENEDGRFLVAPYGERNWVKNARAAGGVELSRGRRAERLRIEEVPPVERAAVLREYLRKAGLPVKGFFDARSDSPLEAFAAEADRHPVFRLQ